MFYLCFDYGEKKIGVAYANDDITYPLEIIDNNKDTFNQISQMVELYDVTHIVVGVSRSSGKDTKISVKAQKFGNALASHVGIEVEFVGEEYSSQDAITLAHKLGYDTKKRLDDVAAAIILQGFLDDKNIE